ncbi:glycosyltransferase [Aestuariibius insulae]|uniref:glycosyltransferase n=1 Tax=Aestuariibius insulae TaxID=2058287 RepID=UPI00345E3C17
MSGAPHVTVLMASYNGRDWLPAQVDSLFAQTHENWSLQVSDDGSVDGTRDLLDVLSAEHPGRIAWQPGPGRGAAQNFLALVRDLPEAPGWIAFADQDDVWFPDKIERGVAALKGEAGPALYCSVTRIAEADLTPREVSDARPRPLGFRNALVQNVVAGNTILVNPAAARLLRQAAQRTGEVVMHDWWVYLLLSGAGAALHHDTEPGLLYRQHGGNEVGANKGARARLMRVGMILTGRYKQWTDTNMAWLRSVEDLLTEENRALMEEFDRMRAGPLSVRSRLVDRLGLYRQTRLSTQALRLAAALGRI